MARRSNKSIAEIVTSTDYFSFTDQNDNDDNNPLISLERKVSLATEGFATHKFCELVLKDRNRLSRENASTICDYVIAMKREINPRTQLQKKYYTVFANEYIKWQEAGTTKCNKY